MPLTLQEWNARMPCCCPMPACPIPIKTCESLSTNAESRGFFYSSDTEWKLYARRYDHREISGTDSYSTTDAYYGVMSQLDVSISASSDIGTEWDHPFEAGQENEYGCIYLPATEDPYCTAEGYSTSETSERYFWGEPDEDGHFANIFAPTRTETREITGPGSSPCTWEMTTTIVIHAHYFGYNFDGSSADPDDPVAFAAWEAGGCVGGPPSSGTATLVTEINNLSPLIPPFESTGDYTDTTETRYELPLTYIEWLATVRAAVDAEFNFDEAPAECLGTDCTAALTEIYETTPGYDQEIILTKVRYRYQVPVEHLGTYFKATWDEWSFPSVGPPAVITADITEEWTGPGSGAQSDPSWDLGTWHTLQIPDEPGTSSTANFRFLCKHPGRYGAALQTDGPAAP